MKRMTLMLFSIVMCFFALSAHADTVVLRGGKTIQGTFLGANARQIDFVTTAGKTEQISIETIDRISFSTASPASKPAAPSSRKTSGGRREMVIPAGTTIRVRTIDPIDVDATEAGAKFRGSIDDPIMVGGSVVVPRGADVILQAAKVKQSGKMKGSDLVELKLNSITVNGSPYQVVTTFQQISGGSEGKSTAKKLIGGAGLGTIVGAIAGGGKGAAIGAAAGAAGGAAISAGGEQHLKVQPETRLEFQLQSDLKI